MKLYHSANSPFVRKVMIATEALGIADRIELIPARGNVFARDPAFRAVNPSGQIPTLVTDQGDPLFDSPVICEYLDTTAGGSLFGQGEARWRNLRDQALGDTMLDAALQTRYESAMRPAELRWADWQEAWSNKVVDTMALLDARAGSLAGRMDIGVIAIFCALSYIDVRLADTVPWRDRFPALASWFSAIAAHPYVTPSAPD
jgi:glutathione S-transferase